MKNQNVSRIAIVVIAMCFAAVAQAQTVSSVGAVTSPQGVDPNIDSLQVDYVTVGAVLPYSSSSSSTALSQWLADLNAAGLSANVEQTTKWYGGADGTTLLAALNNQSAVYLEWPTKGAFTLKVEQSMTLNGNAACTPAVSAKKVYVLDNPLARVPAANKAVVLPCDSTGVTLAYEVAGIGAKEVTYTINRKAYGAAAGVNDAAAVESLGTAVTSTGDFAAAVDITTANAKYTTFANGQLRIDNLLPGYVYTVTLNSVSDQISRKSFAADDAKIAIAADNQFTVLVTPTPQGTKILHVKNIE